MTMSKPTTPLEATGMYWFVNTEISKNLPAARLRMREIQAMGFTEVWIAVRGLEEIGDAPTSLLCENYRRFLEVVTDEADHLGLGVVPFVMPCGLGYLEAARFDHVITTEATADGGDALRFCFGKAPEPWAQTMRPFQAFAYRVIESDLGKTADASTVRPLSIDPARVKLDWSKEEGLAATVSDIGAAAGEEVFLSLKTDNRQGPPDITAPVFLERLIEVVRFHEEICGGHPSYIGLAFDEPNIGDPADMHNKRERVRRFYLSDSLVELLEERRGFRFDRHGFAMARPDSEIGLGLRFTYYEELQGRLMEVMAEAMRHASVPMLGTHDWSGDRDRALYYTFDQLQFTHTRCYGATDISGPQWEFEYAVTEPLMAFQQKESARRERAMMMTDHFRELVDHEWLRYTCERHAALGVDYMLLHAFGHITGDPPLWTRTESWPAYRESFGMEQYTARVRYLGRLRDYRGRHNILVVFPRYSRLTNPGDRFVSREWSESLLSLYRAHYAPLTISQADLDRVTFSGDMAEHLGHQFKTLVFPYFTTIGKDQMERLTAFHAAGGNLVFTKPNYLFANPDGTAGTEIRAMFERMFGIEAAPEIRRFEDGQTVSYAGRDFRAQRLPDGLSEYDDAYLDFGGRCILETESPAGGRAVLIGFSATILSHGAELHKSTSTDTTALLDEVLAPLARKAFLCEDGSGSEDYFTVGLVRERDGEILFSAHRDHDRASRIHAGNATIHVPAGRGRNNNARGVNVFVHHAEEAVHVVYNPLGEMLREIGLGSAISSIITYDRANYYVHFEGDTLRLALPSGREMRFADVEFGPKRKEFATGIGSGNGQVYAAICPLDNPRRTVLRVTGPETFRFHLSLDASLGDKVAVRCATSCEEGTAQVRREGERLLVEGEVKLLSTLENDVEVLQS